MAISRNVNLACYLFGGVMKLITCGASCDAESLCCLAWMPDRPGTDFSASARDYLRLRDGSNFRKSDIDQLNQHPHLQTPMAASESSRFLAKSLPRAFTPSSRLQSVCWRRNASDQASSKSPISDLESTSLSASVTEDIVKSFDPVARSRARKTQLPRSR